MNNSYAKELSELIPNHKYFIGIDSDGCVFDTMEIKHKKCFSPNTILHWNLQPISNYVSETWNFVNLYSKTRGLNRFLTLIKVIELLSERKEVKDRKVNLPDISDIIEWSKRESRLSNSSLADYLKNKNSASLEKTLEWSLAITEDIQKMVKEIPPFQYADKSIKLINEDADLMVISQTPIEALHREWKENNLDEFIRLIAGQEYGNKSEHILYGAKGKYDDEKILMIGDAPGDMEAAKANWVSFYPIIPGDEENSWKRFYNESLYKFFSGKYKGEYENVLIKEFEQSLPSKPSWKVK